MRNGFGNGSFDVGEFEAYYFHAGSDMSMLDHNLPNYDCELGFMDVQGSQLSEKDVEILYYEVLMRKRPPRDFYENLFELNGEVD
jgi:hypothetical protein